MANQTIPTLTPILTVTGLEQIWVAYGGSDYRMTTAQIAAFGAGGGGSGVLTAISVPSSTSITAPGCYVAINTGITITLGAFVTYGLVTIADGTYNANPNITIAGTINGQTNFVLTNPGEAVDLIWFPATSTWIIK